MVFMSMFLFLKNVQISEIPEIQETLATLIKQLFFVQGRNIGVLKFLVTMCAQTSLKHTEKVLAFALNDQIKNIHYTEFCAPSENLLHFSV